MASLTVRLAMSYIYLYLYTTLYIYTSMEFLAKPEICTLCIYNLRLAKLKDVFFYLLHNFSTRIKAENFAVSHLCKLCVNILPATEITLIKNEI
jgi:hypothetical protein